MQQIRFPNVSGKNLNGRKYNLPTDFEGRLNIVLLAFKRRQQALIDGWLNSVKRLAAEPAIEYYELPTVYKMSWPQQLLLDRAMRGGIQDEEARSRTITLYTDIPAFLSALDLPHDETIYALLVGSQGEICWRSSGPHTAAKEAELARALASGGRRG